MGGDQMALYGIERDVLPQGIDASIQYQYFGGERAHIDAPTNLAGR